jgi:hypothetical protein
MGTAQLGTTIGTSDIISVELPKKAFLYKSSRVVQVEIRTTTSGSNYELLGMKIIGIPQSRGNSPSAWNVS